MKKLGNIKIFWHRLKMDLFRRESRKPDRVIKFFIAEITIKGILLWLLSLSFFPLFSGLTVRFLRTIARRTHILSNARFVTSFFISMSGTPQKRFLAYSLFFLIWGALDFVEATGLWQRRRWAEYLATVGTALLIPVEIYTILTRFTIEKLAITLFNIFLVVYFIRSRKLFQF